MLAQGPKCCTFVPLYSSYVRGGRRGRRQENALLLSLVEIVITDSFIGNRVAGKVNRETEHQRDQQHS